MWSDQLLQDSRLSVLTSKKTLGMLKHQMSRENVPAGVLVSWEITKKKD